MSDIKIQISIYKIEEKDQEDMAVIIESKGYTSQELEREEIDGYRLSLFYQKKDFNPKWKDYFHSIAKSDQAILKGKASSSEGFVLLLLNEKNESLYAVTGGSGYFAIQENINSEFGMDIFSRIIRKEDKILKATKEKSVVGSIVGTTKYFRKDFNLFETDSFGKIYQEVKARLDKRILTGKLRFIEDDIKRESVCIAKSSFKINKAISFKQLLKIINGCESILKEEQPISINNVEKLIKNKNISLIQNLDSELLNQLWERFAELEDSYSFDLCHKDFEKYLTASEYVVKKGLSGKNFFNDYKFDELLEIDDLFRKLKESDDNPSDKDEFINLIESLKIYSIDEEGNELTKDLLRAHLLGDVTYNEQKYFYIDKSWYRIKDEFLTELNSSCKSFIAKNFDERLEKKWDFPNEDENKYNQKYIGEENTIVLDKITPENIEPCDILRWDEKNLYFYHVKAGFGNTMRDLCSQIVISANRITHDLNSSKEYIRKIYDTLRSKIGGKPYYDLVGKQTEQYSEEEFLKLFEKDLFFVLAVLDTASARVRNIKNIEQFKSNIAKFSLQELVKEMKGLDINFKIAQINKAE